MAERDLAPSAELRKWLNTTRKNGPNSKDSELTNKTHLLLKLIADAADRDIRLVYTSSERRNNNAAALRHVIDGLLAHWNQRLAKKIRHVFRFTIWPDKKVQRK